MTALKKLPSEIRSMTLPQVYELFDYWKSYPPEHESLALLLGAYTTWEPKNTKTEAEIEAEHRASLEARWKAGAMRPDQLFALMGGNGKLGQAIDPRKMPGIGPFPGL